MRAIYMKDDQEKSAGVKFNDPEGRFLDNEARERVLAALERLPEKLQRVFVLREMEGFSHPEIGRILKVPVGTVKTRFHRAIMKLRREMRELMPVPEKKCEGT
jgi:RNA polymerase sigma-70 factor (ECF subfamily)